MPISQPCNALSYPNRTVRIGLGALAATLLQSAPVWGQPQIPPISAPLARDYSTQARDLQTVPTQLAQANPSQTPSDAPAAPQSDDARSGNFKRFGIGLGSRARKPTILRGANRQQVALPGRDRLVGGPDLFLSTRLADNQAVVLEVQPGVTGELLNAELTYNHSFDSSFDSESPKQQLSLQIFNQRSRSPAFENGNIGVDLPNGDAPWVDRLGGGVEYHRRLGRALGAAVGVNYQRVAIRDGIISPDLQPIDELGNPLTVDDDGDDILLMFAIAGTYDTVDVPQFPTKGTRIRLGLDQSIPVGEANLDFTRLEANLRQFFPLRLYRSQIGPQVLSLNLQAGTALGDDLPPYEAFNLGGSESVRGFDRGEVGSGDSFILASAELRLPILRKWNTDFGVDLFVDYGDDLETGDDVIGQPAIVRDKPGDGLGYGFGVFANLPVGLLNLQIGFNDDGGSEFHVRFSGDR